MRRFGVEIEGFSSGLTQKQFTELVERETDVPFRVQGWSRASSAPITWILTTDGSVKADGIDKGWEIVSPPLDEDSVGQLEKICKAVRSKTLLEKSVFKTNKTCSVHVHIDRSDLSLEELRKVFTLYGRIEDELNLMFPESRRNNKGRGGLSYCGPIKNIEFEAAVEKKTEELKYYSVHFPKGIPTIEFRIHSATTDYRKILSWVKLLNEIIDYALAHPLLSSRNKTPYLSKVLSPAGYEYYKERVAKLSSTTES